MSEQRLDVELAAGENRVYDQAVPVAADVEYPEAAYEIGIRERGTNGCQVRPIRALGQRIPGYRFLLNVLDRKSVV